MGGFAFLREEGEAAVGHIQREEKFRSEAAAFALKPHGEVSLVGLARDVGEIGESVAVEVGNAEPDGIAAAQAEGDWFAKGAVCLLREDQQILIGENDEIRSPVLVEVSSDDCSRPLTGLE